MTPSETAKKSAAIAALEFVKEGMIIGLGTGSTAEFFIDHLAEKCRKGFNIQAVATSNRSFSQAKKQGIPLLDINTLSRIDLAIDGADQIDSKRRLIKGGGGAAVREKIVAAMSKQFIVIADISKCVTHFGEFPLPVEVISFGYFATMANLKSRGYAVSLRKKSSGELFVTDNGNYILDLALPNPCFDPEKEEKIIRNTVGVVDTGFFFDMADQIIIGYPDKSVKFS